MSSNNNQNMIAMITSGSAGEDNAEATPVQPRQPRNLQGLLRFAMEATKAEDAPGNSTLGPMDEERRRFLEEALKSLTVDLAKILQDSIKVLTDTEKIHTIQLGQPLPDIVKSSFDNLLEIIDDIDVSNDFYKLGGFAIFPVCYGSENEEVRTLASTVLAELCQNNPFCQAKALECGLLNVLLNLAQSEQGTALAKCLYAISCASREFEPARREVVAQGGCRTLATLLSAPGAARTKAAFFIAYLCREDSKAREQFIEQNLVSIIAEQIKSGRDESTEHLLSLLVGLMEGQDPRILQQFRDPKIGLQKILEDHLKLPELVTDNFAEEKQYCRDILSVITGLPVIEDGGCEEADR